MVQHLRKTWHRMHASADITDTDKCIPPASHYSVSVNSQLSCKEFDVWIGNATSKASSTILMHSQVFRVQVPFLVVSFVTANWMGNDHYCTFFFYMLHPVAVSPLC